MGVTPARMCTFSVSPSCNGPFSSTALNRSMIEDALSLNKISAGFYFLGQPDHPVFKRVGKRDWRLRR
jgi:hypothetical protein